MSRILNAHSLFLLVISIVVLFICWKEFSRLSFSDVAFFVCGTAMCLLFSLANGRAHFAVVYGLSETYKLYYPGVEQIKIIALNGKNWISSIYLISPSINLKLVLLGTWLDNGLTNLCIFTIVKADIAWNVINTMTAHNHQSSIGRHYILQNFRQRIHYPFL